MNKHELRAAASSRIVWLGVLSAVLATLAPMLDADPDLPDWLIRAISYCNAGLATAMVAIRGSDKVRGHRAKEREATGTHEAMP